MGFAEPPRSGCSRACKSPLSSHPRAPTTAGSRGCSCRSTNDASQNSDATYPHTAHQSGSVKVEYRFHPFFDHPATVLRTSTRGEVPAVLVRVLSKEQDSQCDLKIVVPCWMLDPDACSRVVVKDKPLIGLQALVRLRGLVDQFDPCSTEHHPDSRPNHATGAKRATPENTPATRCKAPTEATDV